MTTAGSGREERGAEGGKERGATAGGKERDSASFESRFVRVLHASLEAAQRQADLIESEIQCLMTRMSAHCAEEAAAGATQGDGEAVAMEALMEELLIQRRLSQVMLCVRLECGAPLVPCSPVLQHPTSCLCVACRASRTGHEPASRVLVTNSTRASSVPHPPAYVSPPV